MAWARKEELQNWGPRGRGGRAPQPQRARGASQEQRVGARPLEKGATRARRALAACAHSQEKGWRCQAQCQVLTQL